MAGTTGRPSPTGGGLLPFSGSVFVAIYQGRNDYPNGHIARNTSVLVILWPMTNHKRNTRGREAATKGATVARERCVIYVRISMDRDGETSTGTQEASCRAYAEMHGMDVAAVIAEPGRSAWKDVNRPGFDRAMRMIETGAANTLVVWRLDRFMRDAIEFMAEWSRIDAAGGRFASVTESMDTSTPLGRLAVMIIATLAEMESVARSERALPWHAHRRDLGLPPVGPIPYGYDRPAPNVLTINDDEAAVIREMFDGLLLGDSLRQWETTLNNRGVPTKRGRGWNTRAIKHIVTSATVAGLVEHDDELTQGNWDAIVTPDELALMRNRLRDPQRRTVGKSGAGAIKHWATALVTCGACGSSLRSRPQSGTMRYQCRDCGRVSIAANVVHSTITDAVMNIDPAAWAEMRMRGRTAAPVVVESVEQEANELAAMFAAKRITLAQFTVMNDALTERIANASTREVVDLPDVDSIHASWERLSADDKRLVIRAFFGSITVAASAPGVTGADRIVIVERDHETEPAAA